MPPQPNTLQTAPPPEPDESLDIEDGIDDPLFDYDRGERLRAAFDLLTPADLGTLLNDTDPRTLALWRAQRRGPDYAKLGRGIFYRAEDIRAWIKLNVTSADPV
jgi:hypothetical protein